MEPLRVCLDARIKDGAWGGVQQLLIGLASGLSALRDGSEEYYFLVQPDHSSGWLTAHLRGPCRLLEAPVMAKPRARQLAGRVLNVALKVADPIVGRLMRVSLPESDGTIERAGIDVMHFTTQGGFLTEKPTIYQPFDLQHLHHPEFFSAYAIRWREIVYRRLCAEAKVVVVMSRWVKEDVETRYGLAPDRVRVVNWAPVVDAYPAPTPADLSRMREKYGLPEAFAFYPAQTWRHKNHLGLLEALAHLRARRGLRVTTVFSGGQNDFYPTICSRIERLGLQGQVRFLGYVSPLELRCLYDLCRFVVFPTLFEGGGMPIFESFRSGVPVACSGVTCLPDQVGDAALLFDPTDVPGMAAAIQRLWEDAALRRELAQRSKARVAAFTWDRTARHYRAIYRLVGGRPLTEEDQRLLDEPPLV